MTKFYDVSKSVSLLLLSIPIDHNIERDTTKPNALLVSFNKKNLNG
jgi:hypothetical protein